MFVFSVPWFTRAGVLDEFSRGRTETDEVRDLLGVAFAVNRLRTHGRIGDGFEDVVASSRRIVGRERAH